MHVKQNICAKLDFRQSKLGSSIQGGILQPSEAGIEGSAQPSNQRPGLFLINCILFILASVLTGNTAIGQTWFALGQGADAPVSNLVVDTSAGLLYAGGDFEMADGKTVNCIASWDGMEWDSLGPGANFSQGSCATDITAMAIFQGQLYIAGDLFSGGGNDIGRWTGSQWDTVLSDPLQTTIITLYAADSMLYALGAFENIGGIQASLIAKWNGNAWSAIDTTKWDQGWRLLDMEFYQGDLYIAGNFASHALGIKNIAKFNGDQWEPVGEGIIGGTAWVNDLQLYQDKLIAGGLFNESLGNPGNGIAAWDGNNWSRLGLGIGGLGNARIDDMAVHDGALFAAGVFSTAGAIATEQIASWDGGKWCGPGDEINNTVSTLAEFEGELIMGGGFETISGSNFSHIARWAGGAFSQLCSPPVGTSDPDFFEVKISPNPVVGRRLSVQISNDVSENVTISFLNIQGQELFFCAIRPGNSRFEISTEALEAGPYVIRLTGKDFSEAQLVIVP